MGSAFSIMFHLLEGFRINIIDERIGGDMNDYSDAPDYKLTLEICERYNDLAALGNNTRPGTLATHQAFMLRAAVEGRPNYSFDVPLEDMDYFVQFFVQKGFPVTVKKVKLFELTVYTVTVSWR